MTTGEVSEVSSTGATLSGSYSGASGTVSETGFYWGTSEGNLSNKLYADSGSGAAGSFSKALTGLAASTTYYYKAYVIEYNESTSSNEYKYGTVNSFTTASLPTWLDSYEIPANNASSVSTSNTLYNGYYSHSTVSEIYGSTQAAIYNTSNSKQKIVVHTFVNNSKVLSNYSMLYDGTKKCALWVAYQHTAVDYTGNVGRNDGWAYDPALETSWQPNLSSSYSDANGNSYDRGHQVASNDRQATVAQNKQTFYYSNMTPQYSSLNQGQWGTHEGKVQTYAKSCGSNEALYVVTGPLFIGTITITTDASGSSCPIPTGYYKCIMKCTLSASGEVMGAVGCGYIVETNSANVAPTVVTIDYVEQKTGFDFFANLPDTIETAAENQSTDLL